MFEARSLASRPAAAAPRTRSEEPRQVAAASLDASLARAERFGHRLEALAAPPASNQVIQRRWKYVDGSGHPGDYYWEGRDDPSGSPPNGGRHIPPPPPRQLEDTHKGGGGGNMKALRTDPDREFQDLEMLAHLSTQAQQQKGIFYSGPTESRGLGRTPVSTSIPNRDKGLHTSIFREMTGGESSSTKYQQSLGTKEPNTKYQILHGMGHGEGGGKTQDRNNLASASEGTNTYMIPYDKAISGNPDIEVDSSFSMRKGTHRAEVVHQKFFHKDLPDEPIFSEGLGRRHAEADGLPIRRARTTSQPLQRPPSPLRRRRPHQFLSQVPPLRSAEAAAERLGPPRSIRARQPSARRPASEGRRRHSVKRTRPTDGSRSKSDAQSITLYAQVYLSAGHTSQLTPNGNPIST